MSMTDIEDQQIDAELDVLLEEPVVAMVTENSVDQAVDNNSVKNKPVDQPINTEIVNDNLIINPLDKNLTSPSKPVQTPADQDKIRDKFMSPRKNRPKSKLSVNTIRSPLTKKRRRTRIKRFNEALEEKIPEVVTDTVYVAILSFLPYFYDDLKDINDDVKSELHEFMGQNRFFNSARSRKKSKWGGQSFNELHRRHVLSDQDIRFVLVLNPSNNSLNLEYLQEKFNCIKKFNKIGIQAVWFDKDEFESKSETCWAKCRSCYKHWKVRSGR